MNAGNQTEKLQNDDVIDLKELVLALVNQWKMIIMVTIVTTIIASVYTFFFA